jgi:hypothetical protein
MVYKQAAIIQRGKKDSSSYHADVEKVSADITYMDTE